MDRNRIIIKTSVLGIVMNTTLVIFKMVIGLIVNSIAIVLDAINNLSDAISSIITIIGTKLASKRPDKEHPYGHGRIEYFASFIIAVIILIAGITAGKESIEKIIQPTRAEYNVASIIIVTVAIIVKYFYGKYVKKIGENINSQSLIASGTDAFMDAVLSFSTLIAAIISIIWQISLEGYLGFVISVIIVKSSYDILRVTISSIIGSRADSELTRKLKQKVNEFEEVQGVYDIMLHNYGPSHIIGSIHIQVDDNMTAKQIHRLTRKIQLSIYLEFGITLTIGIYASNNSEELYTKIKNDLLEIIKNYKEIIQMHGFYVDEDSKLISFDLIVDFKANDSEKTKNDVQREIEEKYPEYNFFIILDSDFSD